MFTVQSKSITQLDAWEYLSKRGLSLVQECTPHFVHLWFKRAILWFVGLTQMPVGVLPTPQYTEPAEPLVFKLLRHSRLVK